VAGCAPEKKPVHIAFAVRPSMLSTEHPDNNYRGFVNVIIILLIMANMRIVIQVRGCKHVLTLPSGRHTPLRRSMPAPLHRLLRTMQLSRESLTPLAGARTQWPNRTWSSTVCSFGPRAFCSWQKFLMLCLPCQFGSTFSLRTPLRRCTAECLDLSTRR
jgi:hypothetical protein